MVRHYPNCRQGMTLPIFTIPKRYKRRWEYLQGKCLFKELSSWLPNVKLPVYGATLDSHDIYQVKRFSEGYIVVGNESKGIRQNIMPFIEHPVTIPAKGRAESLNAAVATGIILSHLVKWFLWLAFALWHHLLRRTLQLQRSEAFGEPMQIWKGNKKFSRKKTAVEIINQVVGYLQNHSRSSIVANFSDHDQKPIDQKNFLAEICRSL